jgi:hypothetical protein
MANNLIERVNITTTQSYWSGHRALTLKKATIKSFITLILIVCFTTAHGQRMSLADVMQLYAASINADQGKITKITQNLQADASNWSDPKISSHKSSISSERNYRIVEWKYIIDGNIHGILTKRLYDNPQVLSLLKFTFPYQIQYDSYNTDIAKIATVVNRYTDKNGIRYQVHEDDVMVYATEYMPPSSERYFVDGQARPFYGLTMHLKLDK